VLIERRSVQEWRPAFGTEVLRRERFRVVQALGADRDTRNARERLLTDPAILGKYEGKKRREEAMKGRPDADWDCLSETTT
jgi:hypothetical protein